MVKKFLIAVPIALGLLVTLVLCIWWLHGDRGMVSIEDARVKGEMVVMSASVAGRVCMASVREGQRVEVGQEVVRLEEVDFQGQVEAASAALRAAEAETSEAESLLELDRRKLREEVDRETAALERARAGVGLSGKRSDQGRASSLGRQSGPSNRGYIYYESRPSVGPGPWGDGREKDYTSRREAGNVGAEIQEREARLRAAAARGQELDARERRVELLRARSAEARVTLESASRRLAAATVIAPVGGTVVWRAVNEGEMVSPGRPLAVLVDMNRLWVEAPIGEALLAQIRPGQIANLKVKAFPDKTFAGTVAGIGTAVDPKRLDLPDGRREESFTGETGRFLVKIEVPNEEGLLKPGMQVSVRIALKTEKGESDVRFGKVPPPGGPQ